MLGNGSHFQWYFTSAEITDYRSAATTNAVAYRAFVDAIFNEMTLFLPNPLSHHAISLGHDDGMIDELGSIFEHGLEAAAKDLAL